MNVLWFSGGGSSFVSAYLMRDEIDRLIYIHIDDQHPDTLRFLKDAEKLLGREIEILQSPYKSVDRVISMGYIVGVAGAPCTNLLKRRVRKEWEHKYKDEDITYIWGLDCAESHRADRIVANMPDFKHRFPLIEKQLSKQDVHGMMNKLGIKRPVMYDMGYQNNNCIGCVKGGMWYWNKIRKDFPDVFSSRAKREREIGATILRSKGEKLYLDELEPNRGREDDEITEDCGIFCQINI